VYLKVHLAAKLICCWAFGQDSPRGGGDTQERSGVEHETKKWTSGLMMCKVVSLKKKRIGGSFTSLSATRKANATKFHGQEMRAKKKMKKSGG